MRRAKSIDELYKEVRDHDIVIANDAALVTALNGRIASPKIGGFAYTPRHIAEKVTVPEFGKGVMNDLTILSEISKETGYGLKHIHSEIENIRMIRGYTKEVRKYLYSNASRKIYDSFLGCRTLEKLMDSYVPEEREFFKGKKVAVIGIDFFDDLDKHFVPIDHDEIEIFTEGGYGIDTIYEVGNDRQIAENAVSLIEKGTAEDTAIVLDTAGPIADAVRAALYRRDIPFKNTMSVKDLSQVRDYLQFLSLSLSYETLRVRHVRELLSGYKGFFSQKQDEYLLHKIEDHLDEKTKELVEVMKTIRNHTFQQVCDKVVENAAHRPQIKMVIEDMNISGNKVTSRDVNELSYAVNNIDELHHNEEIPDKEKGGVLLVDCLKSVYVDRPFVIYLGLGPEWSFSTVGKDYIDRDNEALLNMYRFSVLLQQGESRLYLVNSMRNGKEATPCPVFEQIREDEAAGEEGSAAILSFGDAAKTLIKGQWASPQTTEPAPRADKKPGPADMKNWRFSKSSYNGYFACPRAYMYGRMIHIPDSEKTIFGDIIHQFAEFYLCYPELVKGRAEDYTEMIRGKYSGLSSQQMEEIDGSKIRVCMANVVRFIDSLSIKDVPLDRDNSKREHKNMFMEMHSCAKYSSMTETKFTASAHPLSGNFDLVIGNRIVDYKTGKANTLKEIKDRMDTSKKQNYFEFQPMIYLSLIRDNSPPPYTFSLVYLADNDVRSVTDENFRINENIRNVALIPESMREFLSNPNSPVKIEFEAAVYKKIVEGWTSFVDRVFDSGIDPEAWKDDEALISSVAGMFGMKGKTGTEAVARALKKLSEIVSAGMFSDETEVVIPSDTLEKFLSRLDKDHDSASEQRYSDFPAAPRIDCGKCSFFKACTRDIIDLEEGDEDE